MKTWHRGALAVLPLAATTPLLAGCVPLDTPAPTSAAASAHSSDEAHAISPSDPTPDADGWEHCIGPVVESRTPTNEGWIITTAVEMDTTSGSEVHRVLLDEHFGTSLTYDSAVPEAARFTVQIGQTMGYPVRDVGGGLAEVLNMQRSIKEPSKTLGYRAVEKLSIPFTLVCGNQGAAGIAHSWNTTETGVIDCTLAPAEPAGSPAALAREDYCPKA